jgi:phenylacetic acid degradation operon negative regulatory protein
VTPNPRHLVLKLLLGAEGAPISARDAIAACALFGIRENSVRVALVRLSAAGMIEAEGRGTYRFGPNAAELAENVRTWRTAESRLRKWSGRWIAVHCGGLGRSDRAALRQRDRALELLGFRELDRGLFVRPDNLAGGVEEVRDRLYKLGLEAEAAVFVLGSLDDEREARARTLWKGKALTRSYVQWRQRLEKWLASAKDLDLEAAARESFLLGNGAIRHLVFDPLLPDPLTDVNERRAFVDTLIEFDRAGHAIWQELAFRQRSDTDDASHRALAHH